MSSMNIAWRGSRVESSGLGVVGWELWVEMLRQLLFFVNLIVTEANPLTHLTLQPLNLIPFETL